MRYLLAIIYLILSFSAYSQGTLTTLPDGATIYSEFYPNPSAKFKGTIIFINGSGADISEWKSNTRFFNCIKKYGSFLLFDRPGVGKSPPNLQYSPKNPLTARLASDELSSLLKQLDLRRPYIVVAHSFGSMFGGYFTLNNPDTVKGLLLIDPAPRDFHYSPKGMEKYQKGIEEAKTRSADYIYKKYGGDEAELLYIFLGFDESKQSIKNLGNINGFV